MGKTTKFKFEDFVTKDKENDGLKFTLETPAGEPTDIWVVLYGSGSTAMKAALSVFKAKLKKAGKEASQDIDSPENCEFLAASIKDWNLDIPCNYDNRLRLVTECKSVRTFINGMLNNDRLYFLLGQPRSSKAEAMQSDSSSSGNGTKAE